VTTMHLLFTNSKNRSLVCSECDTLYFAHYYPRSDITKQPPPHPFNGFPYPQTWNEMSSSVSLNHENPHQYPVQDGIKHDLICKLIVLQINIPSASYIDFIFKHNRKANRRLVCRRKGHTFNCRVCCRIIVH
jgi:hypothetical protein